MRIGRSGQHGRPKLSCWPGMDRAPPGPCHAPSVHLENVRKLCLRRPVLTTPSATRPRIAPSSTAQRPENVPRRQFSARPQPLCAQAAPDCWRCSGHQGGGGVDAVLRPPTLYGGDLRRRPRRASRRSSGKSTEKSCYFKWSWRRGRDSNPRYGCPYAAFRVRCIQPLCHLSARSRPALEGRACI